MQAGRVGSLARSGVYFHAHLQPSGIPSTALLRVANTAHLAAQLSQTNHLEIAALPQK